LGNGADRVLRKYQGKTHSSLISDKNTGLYTRRLLQICDNTSLNISWNYFKSIIFNL
jgi:hypothetical protein